MITSKTVFNNLQLLREKSPVIHSITNFVAMPTTANILLAIGASPVMAHAPEELAEILNIVNALNINIGTLDESWCQSIEQAQQLAQQNQIPVVFDPAGCGATSYRTRTAKKILANGVTILKGNASEILSLADNKIKTKGVDATHNVTAARQAAKDLSAQYNCIVVISGSEDLVIDHSNEILISHGSSLFSQVTGMGCSLAALIAAFSAIEPDFFQAAASAVITLTIAGELAEQQANGPGSFYSLLLDQLSCLNEKNFYHLKLKTNLI